MRRFVLVVLALCLGLPLANGFAAPSGPEGFKVSFSEVRAGQSEAILRVYASIPKGIVLEGTAEGIEELKTLAYDK
jgi:hypothetical protein